MRLYVASQLDHIVTASAWAHWLAGDGHVVVSRWHEDAGNTPALERALDREGSARIADANIRCVRDAEALVVVGSRPTERVGRFVEIGIALGIGIPVHYVEPEGRLPLMCSGSGVTTWPDLDTFRAAHRIEEAAE